MQSRIGTLKAVNDDAWKHRRNTKRDSIKWMFDTHRAREKLARTYPKLLKES